MIHHHSRKAFIDAEPGFFAVPLTLAFALLGLIHEETGFKIKRGEERVVETEWVRSPVTFPSTFRYSFTVIVVYEGNLSATKKND
jgi:hypothetical protein